MTDKQTPTDAEILELASQYWYSLDEAESETEIELVRAALAKWGQPAQAAEPVAWLDPWTGTKVTTDYGAYGKHGIPLYTAPQPVAREPLTPERLREIERMCVYANTATLIDFARAIERAHGIKGCQHVE